MKFFKNTITILIIVSIALQQLNASYLKQNSVINQTTQQQDQQQNQQQQNQQQQNQQQPAPQQQQVTQDNKQQKSLINPEIVNKVNNYRQPQILYNQNPTTNIIQANGFNTQMQRPVMQNPDMSQQQFQRQVFQRARPVSINSCPCAGVQQNCPVCGIDSDTDSNFESCPCDPNRTVCPPCILAKTVKQMHQQAANNAKVDSNTQEQLAKSSDLEKQLFAQAKKFAQEAETEENLSYELSLKLQQHASKAQIARNKMIKAEQQAKQIALETIHSMSVYPAHQGLQVPGLTVKQNGVKRSAIYSSQPQYSLSIANTDESGFLDQNDFDFQQEIEKGQQGQQVEQNNEVKMY